MADMRPRVGQAGRRDGPHEDGDVRVKGILMFALGLVALGRVIHVVLGLSCKVSPGGNRKARRWPPPFLAVDVVPPAPLQAIPPRT